MQQFQPSLFARPDTFFGVCQGLGEDIGFHPNILRMAFAGFIFWNPVAAAISYAALGAIVFATRFLYPVPSVAPAQAEGAGAAAERRAAPIATMEVEADRALESLAA